MTDQFTSKQMLKLAETVVPSLGYTGWKIQETGHGLDYIYHASKGLFDPEASGSQFRALAAWCCLESIEITAEFDEYGNREFYASNGTSRVISAEATHVDCMIAAVLAKIEEKDCE